MDSINSPNDNFDFNSLVLNSPVGFSGGNHFIKFLFKSNPLYIQPPKCVIKQNTNKGTKKMYCDLMFTNENEDFIRWLENLEQYSQKFIFDNRNKWFETELDENDIENSFTSPIKTYKSGKFYILRVNIPVHLGKSNINIFDEDGNNNINIETIDESNKVLAALEFKGIKCSPRSFQMEIELKQLLLLKKNNLFENCVLKLNDNVVQPVSPKKESIIENMETELKKTEPEVLETVETEVLEKTEPEVLENNESEILEKIEQEVLEKQESLEEEKKEEPEEIETLELIEEKLEPEEIEIPLEEIKETETIKLKNRNDIYYGMYKDALAKAKKAKELAVVAYLEAKHIKNTYMLEDMDESDLEDDSISTSDE